jgi:O-antigen/teichoic acid export membrane protein
VPNTTIAWSIPIRSLGYGVITIIFLYYLLIRNQNSTPPEYKRHLKDFSTLLKFSTPLFVSDLFFVALTWFDQFYLYAKLGATTVAIYNIPLTLVDFLMLSLLPLRSVLLPTTSKQVAQGNMFNPQAKLMDLCILFTLFANLLAGLSFMFSPFIFSIYGQEFKEAIPLFTALLPSFMLRSLSIPLMIFSVAYLKRPQIIMKTQGTALISNIFFNVFLISLLDVWGAVLSMSLTHLISVGLYIFVLKYYGLKLPSSLFVRLTIFSTPLLVAACVSWIMPPIHYFITLGAIIILCSFVSYLILYFNGSGEIFRSARLKISYLLNRV